MATVLIAWELGGGLGHLVQLAPLARALAARGGAGTLDRLVDWDDSGVDIYTNVELFG